MSKSKGKKRTPDVIRKEAQDNLDKALDCFKAACEAMSELLALHAAQAGMQQEPEPQKQVKPAQRPTPEKPTANPAQKKPVKVAKKPAESAGSTIPTVTATPERAPVPRHRTPTSARLTPHEITLNIGSHAVKELAENDAKDLLNNPKVFWYRPMQFPDPRRYQVQPRVEGARVVKRSDAKFARAPWTVSVTIALIGDDKRCDSWGVGVLAKNKGDQE